MNFQNDRYTLRLARPEDDAGILEIFASGHFDGGIALQYQRPSPLASFAADGDAARMLVICDNTENRIAAVGGAVVRTEFLRGKPERCAYLTGLKIHPDYQKQIFFIAKAYAFLGEQLIDCRCCYTTILDDNLSVIRMLEKKRRNMPEYRYLGHYTTYCCYDPRCILPLTVDDSTGFAAVQQEVLSGRDLTPAGYGYSGFGEGHFYAFRESGTLLACCFCGDQTAGKCYQMKGYRGIYRFVSKFPTRLFGYPAFPRPGEMIRHKVISRLYIKDNDPVLCRNFLRTVAFHAQCSLLLWGAFETHPLCGVLDKMKTIHYGSRLYQVIWDGREYIPISRQIGLEAALL